MHVEITELGLAYRRVKADLYYAKNANLFKILDFEKNLKQNLARLKSILEEERFFELYSECVGYRIIPKDVLFRVEKDKESIDALSLVRTDGKKRQVDESEFRIIEDLPIIIHLVMQLWIDRVAVKFEKNLSENVYGYRLRRHGNSINRNYPATFKPYIRQYKQWHDGGLSAIDKALNANKHVVAMTADFTAFYHGLSPDFLLEDRYQRAIKMHPLRGDDLILTRVVVKILNQWAKNTPLGKGLPVGCSISAIIANLALQTFDARVSELGGLLYYGRYVDDIILAFENSADIKTVDEFWEYLTKHVKGLSVDQARSIVRYQDPTVMQSADALRFNKSKVRIFFLEPEGGKGFISALKQQIGRRTSEWRALPDLPDDPEVLINSIISITDSQGVEIDKLRKAEDVSIRRAAFAMKLADFGDYAVFLPPEIWMKQRNAFLKAVVDYFCTVKSYFELSAYFPKLVGLASLGVKTNDDESLRLLHSIFKLVNEAIEQAFAGSVKIARRNIENIGLTKSDVESSVKFSVCNGFRESIAAAVQDEEIRHKLYCDIGKCFKEQQGLVDYPIKDFDSLLLADLAWVPYKSILLSVYDHDHSVVNPFVHSIINVESILPDEFIEFASKFMSKHELWRRLSSSNALSGLLFPTRPLKPVELCAILPMPYSSGEGSRNLILDYMRLMSYGDHDDKFIRLNKDGDRTIAVNYSKAFGDNKQHSPKHGARRCRPRVALAYWRVSDSMWEGQFTGGNAAERTKAFFGLMRLLNKIMRNDGHIDYVIFPELAMHWHWFMKIALKLKIRGISLISGVEYIWGPKRNQLSNEVWCYLMDDSLGFPDGALIRVLKTAPAEHEEDELLAKGYLMRTSSQAGEFSAGDVICHGNDQNALFFSVLICSDLTDIALRNKLRGKIDALVVPAWNPDVETFNSLIMAAAFDLHSYVILDNNGNYGDTRIRAPLKERHARNLLQLKGGNNDYYVIGTLDVDSLRRAEYGIFAKGDPKYKPTPIGYKMSRLRRTLVKIPQADVYGLKQKTVKVENNQFRVLFYSVKNRRYLGYGLPVKFTDVDEKHKLTEVIVRLTRNSRITKEAVNEFLQTVEYVLGVRV